MISTPVVILGGGVTSLGLARTFGRRGIDVYIVMEREDEAIYSRYCKKNYLVPEMRNNTDGLKKFLKKIRKSVNRCIIVYPTSDLDALNLAEIKDDISDDICCVVGDKNAVKTLVNKKKFYKVLDSIGIIYPNTYFPEDLEDAKKLGAKIRYPIFIRPSITQLFNRIWSKRKGFIAYSLKELVYYYKLASRFGLEVMFQDIIPGPPWNSYQLEGYYNADHHPTVLFARQRLRIWPPDFGNTTLCVSIPLKILAREQELINDLMRKIKYKGLMSAEFKKDARDQSLKFLEVNARAWWHFWLSANCGADIVYSSYLDALGEKTNYIEDYQTDRKSAYLIPDLMASAHMFLSRQLCLSDWLLSLKNIGQFAFFSRSDLSPFIMHCKFQALQLLKKYFLRNQKEELKKP